MGEVPGLLSWLAWLGLPACSTIVTGRIVEGLLVGF